MDGGNGRKEGAQEDTPNDDNRKSSSESVGNGGTDVDSAILLVRNPNHRGSLTAADRPRPSTGIARGSNVGSHSHHFVGSKKPATYADVGYVRPHHSRADVNISQQAVNDDDHVPKAPGDLSTVQSSKSDTELLSAQDTEARPDDSLTRLSGLLAKAVTLASASEVIHQSNSSNPIFSSHLNKCNSSSNEGMTARRSAIGIEGERGAGTTEGKRSSHSMLGRIKVLTKCLSSSDEGRSREDMTASSEDASTKQRLISKIPKRKRTKKKKKLPVCSGEEVEKSKSDEKSSSGTDVDKASMESMALKVGVSKATTGTEPDKEAGDAKTDNVAVGMETTETKEDITGCGLSEEGLPESSPPDVLKEIKVSSSKEPSPLGLQSETIDDEEQAHSDKLALVSQHSGSSNELLCDYSQHVDGGEQVLSAVVVSGEQTAAASTEPRHHEVIETPPRQDIPTEKDAEKGCIVHHASAPLSRLNQEGDAESQPEIALKAVKERYRVLSEQTSDTVPGVSIDDKLRLAVLGSVSYAAESGEHPEPGRRVASAPGPLENMAQHLAEGAVKDQQIESGISSFDGTYYDESSNHHHGTLKAQKDLGSSNESAKVTTSQMQDRQENPSSSSDSSQDDYVQKMQEAQQLIDSHHTTTSPVSQQLDSPHANRAKEAGDLMDTMQDPVIKLIMNDYSRSLRDIKGGHLGTGSPSASSSGYDSAFQAKIAELEANLSLSEGLGKPYKVDKPMEDSMRKKWLGYVLKMLEKGGGGQGLDSHDDPGLLEAAVSYLYWSRHNAQELLRKPQQHQKVVMEDKLEAQNLQLDLPPHSGFRGCETLEQLKAELELKVKQIEEAIYKNQGNLTPVSRPVNLTPPDADAKYSSSSSSDDSRPPSNFHYNQSVAIMSPGGALGSGALLQECDSAKRVRRETEDRIAELEREKEEMAARMKDQRLSSVQLEAHLLTQLATLTKEYQNLMAHGREHKQLSKELKLQLDRKQRELEQVREYPVKGDTESQQLQDALDTLSFQSKEKIHQLNIRLTVAKQENLQLKDRLRQEAARLEIMQADSKRRDGEAGKERDLLLEKLEEERGNHSRLDDELMSQAKDLHQMATSLQELQSENHTQAGEMRRLQHALEQSILDRAQLQQELQRADQKLDAKHEQWKKQKQELSDHLNETKASLEKSQLHLKTLNHTNRTLSRTAAQLQENYQALNSQLHKERLAKKMTSQDVSRIREELEAERKARSELVNSQLSQWKQNLQTSTNKLSTALQNKICHKEQELHQLKAANTKMGADVPCDVSPCKPSTHATTQIGHFHETFKSHAPRNQPQLHPQHRATSCTCTDDRPKLSASGGLCTENKPGCSGCRQHHKRC